MDRNNHAPRPANRERAEAILAEIVRLTGHDGIGQTKLYKAFWLSHLYYYNLNHGFLSDWPVVKMPNGPGVDQGSDLLAGLSHRGVIRQREVFVGPFQEKRCYPGDVAGDPLPPPAADAIRQAVEFVRYRSAAELSEFSHEMSRSWRALNLGEELDLYADLIPDDECEAGAAEMREFVAATEHLFR